MNFTTCNRAFDIFLVSRTGLETTSETLLWTLLLMAHHPHVQRAVRAEIVRCIRRERIPCWADRVRMSYTNAVLLEVQRFDCFNPIGVPHRIMRDIKLNGCLF